MLGTSQFAAWVNTERCADDLRRECPKPPHRESVGALSATVCKLSEGLPRARLKWLLRFRASKCAGPKLISLRASNTDVDTSRLLDNLWRMGPWFGDGEDYRDARCGDRGDRMPVSRQGAWARPALGLSARPWRRDHRGARGPVEPGPLLRPRPGHAGPDVHPQRRVPAGLAVGLRPGVLRDLAARSLDHGPAATVAAGGHPGSVGRRRGVRPGRRSAGRRLRRCFHGGQHGAPPLAHQPGGDELPHRHGRHVHHAVQPDLFRATTCAGQA